MIENEKKHKHCGKTTLLRIIDGIRRDTNSRLDNMESIIRTMDEKNLLHQQTILGQTKDDRYWKVRKWLLEDRKLTTTAQFYEWINNKEPDVIVSLCYKATFKRLPMEKIVEVAEQTLSDVPLTEVH